MQNLINNTKHPVFIGDLEKLQLSVGLSEGIRDVKKCKPVMIGHFFNQTFEGGLSMHAMNALENQNSSSDMELPPGISFNIVFRGKIRFQFAGECYCLTPIEQKTSCTAIINNATEIMSRKMEEGMQVKKLNIFIEKSWLYSRCRTENEFKQLNRLFSKKKVTSWLPDNNIAQAASQLMATRLSNQLPDRLIAEQLTIATLNMCLSDLLSRVTNEDASCSTTTKSICLKALINQQLEKQTSVSKIANELNMSLRTLQRKFYRDYGKTVSSYIHQRRMGLAKSALVIERKTIGEAAYIAGYSHTSNFISAFKKHSGMTPTQFVKSNTTS